MMKHLLNSAAGPALIVGLLLSGCATTSTSVDTAPPFNDTPIRVIETAAPVKPAAPEAPPAPTAADAKAYVEAAELKLAALSEATSRINWVRANFITTDTMWLESRANALFTEENVTLALKAAQFNDVAVDAVTRRKLNLLKLSLTLPAAERAGAASELADIATRLDSTYSTGKFNYKSKTYDLGQASNQLASSRDPVMLRAMWEGWRTVSVPMKTDYSRLTELANEGARGLGYKDTGALWRSNYDMDPDAFAEETDRLWAQVAPFYKNLHCYTRRQLNAKYGDAVQSKRGPIRADLLGNMWAQDWANIYDIVAPKTARSSYNFDKLLISKAYTPKKIMETAEGFYTSMGLQALPKTFWERSFDHETKRP